MNKKSRSRKFSAKQSARLGAYFAAGVGASMAATSTSEAAIITIDIASFNIGGINGGVGSGSFASINNFPSSGEGTLKLYNNFVNEIGEESTRTYLGISGGSSNASLRFAGGGPPNYVYATPTNFALNQTIDGNAYFGSFGSLALFQFTNNNDTYTSPDFGSGSYMGFRTASGNYGWLEVTWDSAAGQFEIISGAYESEAGVGILAGAGGPGPEPIPEPGTWAAAALLAGGAAFMRWRRRRDEAQKEAA
jgi:hypothetical protein